MRRSPLVRKTPLRSRREGPALDKGEHPRARAHKPPSARPCEYCGKEFLPFQSTQKVCPTLRCAKGYAQAQRKAKEKAERESFKDRKEAIKTIPKLIADADKAFADFIRARDRLAGHPDISSGRALDWSGNQVDAGHYRSRGAASHLRYDENNCHAQSKHDNRFKAGNVVEYRINLIARIGLAAVEALESNNTPHKWEREELIAIKTTYRAKKRELEKRTEQ